MKIRWVLITTCAFGIAVLALLGRQLFVVMAPKSHNVSAYTPAATPPSGSTRWRENASQPSPASDATLAVKKLRFQLVGVIASGDPMSGSQGVALVSIDGKPAQAFRVGDDIGLDQVIQAIQVRSVSIGPRGGATLLSLELQTSDQGAMQTGQSRQSRQLSIGQPPNQPLSDTRGHAPNVLLNNPADMAAADAQGNSALPSR